MEIRSRRTSQNPFSQSGLKKIYRAKRQGKAFLAINSHASYQKSKREDKGILIQHDGNRRDVDPKFRLIQKCLLQTEFYAIKGQWLKDTLY